MDGWMDGWQKPLGNYVALFLAVGRNQKIRSEILLPVQREKGKGKD